VKIFFTLNIILITFVSIFVIYPSRLRHGLYTAAKILPPYNKFNPIDLKEILAAKRGLLLFYTSFIAFGLSASVYLLNILYSGNIGIQKQEFYMLFAFLLFPLTMLLLIAISGELYFLRNAPIYGLRYYKYETSIIDGCIFYVFLPLVLLVNGFLITLLIYKYYSLIQQILLTSSLVFLLVYVWTSINSPNNSMKLNVFKIKILVTLALFPVTIFFTDWQREQTQAPQIQKPIEKLATNNKLLEKEIKYLLEIVRENDGMLRNLPVFLEQHASKSDSTSDDIAPSDKIGVECQHIVDEKMCRHIVD